jgi:hypothetical protein
MELLAFLLLRAENWLGMQNTVKIHKPRTINVMFDVGY